MKKISLLFLLLVFNATAQSVGSYLFNQSTEIYTPIIGSNSSAEGDDGIEDAIPIGFNFNFGGSVYTTFSISTNGFIRLGNPILNQSWVNTLSTTNSQSPMIAVCWDDHNRTTGSIQYAVSGTSPSRVLSIGWDSINIGNGGNVSATQFGSFKMNLRETSGVIEFVYGSTMNLAGGFTASIGLNDLTSFLSISPISATAASSNVTANNNVNSTQFLLGQKFTFTPSPQCSGTPDPGNTIASLTSICEGFPFDLSLQNQLESFGISYQWQRSTSGINYVDIVDENNITLTTSQTVGTFYRCVVSCGTSSNSSTPIEVVMNNPSQCFCFPSYTNGKTDGDLISNVVLTGTSLSNNTGAAPVNPFYTYFSGQPNLTATLQAGYDYVLNVTVGTYQQQNVAVWIDFNDDTNFDADERVGYTSSEIGSNETGVFTLNIPCGAIAGLHRMRIRDVYDLEASTIDPCENYGYGETEDYDVTIELPTGCQAPSGLAISSLSSTSAELLWTAGCNQSSWDVHYTLTGGGPPLSTPSNMGVAIPFSLTGLIPLTAYEFYVRAVCSESSTSSWSGPFLFSTLPVAVANDDCETAVALNIGTTFEENAVIGTNVGATKTIGPPNPTCAIFGFGGDVWYSVVAPPDGNLTLEVRQDPGSPFIDSGLNAFSGSCSGLTTIGCSDDEGIGGFSILNLTGLAPGETVYARVWEFANDTFGTFQFSAYSPTLATNTFNESDLTVYPNPVKDILTLSLARNIKNVTILNLLGQEVVTKEVNDNFFQIDLSHLSAGAYLLRITTNNQQKNIKIIKE